MTAVKDKRVCLLVSDNTSHADSASSLHDETSRRQVNTLQLGCAQRHIHLEPTIWYKHLDYSEFDSVIIGPVWDYLEQKDKFLKKLNEISELVPLFNPVDVIKWNINKTYLRTLEHNDVPIVATLYADHASCQNVSIAFDHFKTHKIIIKPCIGAGAWRQACLEKADVLPKPDRLPMGACMMQPFMPSIVEEGEYSFLFFGGIFSHAILKRPKPGDYRVQYTYGGTECVYRPNQEEISFCKHILTVTNHILKCGDLLYARIDLVRNLDGRFALMEIELIEPYFFPEHGVHVGALFASSLETMF